MIGLDDLDLDPDQVALLERASRMERLMALTGEEDAAALLRRLTGDKAPPGPRPVAPPLAGGRELSCFPVDDWERNGVVSVGPVLDDAAQADLVAAADAVLARAFARSGMPVLADWVARVSQIPNPGDWDRRFVALESVSALRAAAAAALGCAQARCWEAQIVLKPPRRGASLPWHTDRPTWTLPAGQPGVTLWLALDAIEADSGGLWYQPGSHRGRRGGPEVGVMPQPGALLLHHADVLHYSRPNRSHRWRRAWVAVYTPAVD